MVTEIHRVKKLPETLRTNAIYMVLADGSTEFDVYMTGKDTNSVYEVSKRSAADIEKLLTDRPTGLVWSVISEEFRPESLSTEATIGRWGVLDGNFRALHLATTPDRHVYTGFIVPLDYAEGTMIYPQLFWTPKTNKTGGVRFQLEYFTMKADGSGGTLISSSIYINYSIPNTGQVIPRVLSFPEGLGIAGNDLSPGDYVQVRLARITSASFDTYKDDVAVIRMAFHYQCNKIGLLSRPGTF